MEMLLSQREWIPVSCGGLFRVHRGHHRLIRFPGCVAAYPEGTTTNGDPPTPAQLACRVLGAQDIPRALANRDTRGALKIVIDADSRKILGVHAALDGAGDVMLAGTCAIKLGLSVDELADTWAPHLTMSEALRIAAGLFRWDKPTSCCA